jgi:hypothetical protein
MGETRAGLEIINSFLVALACTARQRRTWEQDMIGAHCAVAASSRKAQRGQGGA